MKTLSYTLVLAVAAGLLLIGCDSNEANSADETVRRALDRVRQATEPYRDIAAAAEDGYTVQATDYVSGMGIHYLNPDLLDDRFEAERPEILMYVPRPDGGMELVGVEYATPVDLEAPAPAPEGFSGDMDAWAINEQFSLWTLHAWVWLDNPDGVFAPYNPEVP